MALKWVSALVTVATLGVFATANITTAAVGVAGVPLAVNLALVAVAAGASVLVVVAELYQRVDAKLGALSDFLVARLEELERRSPERGEAYLAPIDSSVVPMPSRPRGRRMPADD